MDQNKLAIASISLDLKRIALGFHRGSTKTAEKFASEALKRRNDLELSSLPLYIQKLIRNLETATNNPDTALMYSTIFQNYSQKLNQDLAIRSDLA